MTSIKAIQIFKFIWVLTFAAAIVLLAWYQLHFSPLEKILILSITLILFFSTYMLFLSDKRVCGRNSNEFEWNCDADIGTPLDKV
jgi:hypothetical protein